MTTPTTIAGIKAANAAAGQHFFSPATMRFFRSRTVGSAIVGPGGVFFVTREVSPSDEVGFTVRQFQPDGEITSASGFFEFDTSAAARAVARSLAAQEGQSR